MTLKRLSLFIFLLILPAIFPCLTIKAASFEKGEILVKFKKSPDHKLSGFLENHNLTNVTSSDISGKNNYFLFQIAYGSDINDKILELRNDRLVRIAQPNYIFRGTKKKKSKNFTSDRFITRQWWIYNNGLIGSLGSDLGLSSVWPQEKKSWNNVAVGIIDSGVNSKHIDLKKNIIKGYDFVHMKGKDVKDKEGHGSFIAGIIASKVNNKKGIAGLSRLNRLKIMPLKFNFTTEEAIEAISYAKNKGVKILNASWGTNEFDQALYDTIKNYDGLLITASGNESEEHVGDNKFYPCDFDLENVICVGASDANDNLTSYGDWGGGIDLLAPGGEENSPIISLDVKTNKYVEAIGSSFSAAFVSGAAGLALSQNPNFSPIQIKNLILENVRKKDELTEKVTSGGILSIANMLLNKN